MIEFKSGKIIFPSRERFGPQEEDQTVNFTNPVRNFAVILTGYEVKFDNADHHIHLANVDVQGTQVSDTTIEVSCKLGLRDHSGHWNDHYSGYVAYTVIAEMEGASP